MKLWRIYLFCKSLFHFLKAEEAMAKCQEFMPHSDDSYTYSLELLADIYCKQGKGKEAIQCLQQVLEIEPNNAEAQKKLKKFK